MEMSEIVCKTREYIEEHGWCKGSQSNERGEVCIWGAYWEVCDIFSLDGISYRFRNAVSDGLPENNDEMDKIVVFNDDPGTTIEDVILHLKRVEARLEAGS